VNSIYFLELTQEFQSTIALLKQHPTNIHKITQLSFNDLKANASQIESATLPLVILPNTLTSEQQNTLNQLHNKGVQFQSFGAFYEEQFRRIPEISLSNRWLLENIQHRHPAGFLFTKRVVDLSCGILMGLVFLITFPFIASLIKLTSSGPILFSQKRRSTRNHDISIAKFRTMKHGTKDDIWTQPNDPRITRIGHILRTTHLDELPQCWNLITGTLSLVGPRPEQSHIVDALQTKIPFYQTRHTVKPGITGWAQLHVYAGSVEETKEKLEYDLYYLKHKSILFDTEIIIKTLFSLMGIKS
ncbi:hypothetical protein HOI18_05505, partial [Candidatus Uhrbacteria bacterium]|nr:hypothetical protein [Candidatus Uhrbacteria bacterium]